jgi:hypothetical protein
MMTAHGARGDPPDGLDTPPMPTDFEVRDPIRSRFTWISTYF